MKLFDLHCDTLYEAYKRSLRAEKISEGLQVSLEAASVFEKYTQVTAIWSDEKLSCDEAFDNFRRIYEYSRQILQKSDFFTPILGVEGGKLLSDKISRAEHLRDCGVKILTLVWKGECAIGGAYDTSRGLTSFGCDVVGFCFENGIVPDLSHASDAMFYDVMKLCDEFGRPAVATHSCSRAVYDHPRNLTDRMIDEICGRGGIVGVNVYHEHLGGTSPELVARHISHAVSVAGEDKVALGCDLDGIDKMPDGMKNIGDLPLIFDILRKNSYSEKSAQKIFYSNAQNFAEKWLF